MRDCLSHVLATLNPFAATPDQYPVIAVGQGERVIQFVVKATPNSKGMIEVQTLPDLADGGKARTFPVRLSTPIRRWHKIKR